MSEPNSPREAVEQHRAETGLSRLGASLKEIAGFPGMPQTMPVGEPPSAKFKVGDVVVLRSGGPRMTVWGTTRPYSLIDTGWFVNGLLQRDAFSESELELAPPKETP